MKVKTDLPLVVALGLLLASGAARAQSPAPKQQPCNTSSVQQYSVVQTGGQCMNQASATAAIECAMSILEASLVTESGASCGPCNIPAACAGSPTNLASQIQVLGPTEVSPGQWAARAWYEGGYHIACSACDA
jgi:hypothetical protein